MSEFKGTKGKWLYDHEQEAILSEDLYMIADIFPPHNRENALLISKAPEMLEFLQSIVTDYENGLIEDIEHVAIRAEQLIKSATDI